MITTALAAEPRPRDVVCLTHHLRRDLLVARDAQRGRFTHNGRTLSLGRPPDWSGGDPDDVEWRIEWIKLYEGLDVAHAYAETAEPDLLATWEDLVESYCAQVPVGATSSDVSARRLQNWIASWQVLRSAPVYRGLRPGLATTITERIRADADHLELHLTAERNHRTLELYALLLVGLALETAPDGAPGPRAVRALTLLADNAVRDVWHDGVHRECSTDYHCIVLRSLLGAIANARRAGLAVPADLVDRAARAADFALHVQRPDGTTPALSDGDEGDYRDLLAVAADLLARPELDWAASGGRRGTPPARRRADFPVGGYHVQRSGWGDRGRPYAAERWAIMDCGPLGDGGHGHYDQLSVELFGAGHRLAVDPGRFTYADGPDGWRRRFKGTAAHNTVLVDGLDQTPYRPGKPKGLVSVARLDGRWTASGVDVIRGTVRSPAYDAVHTRTLIMVDEELWVVHDRLRAGREHIYQARWHLPAQAWGAGVTDRLDGAAAMRVPGGAYLAPDGFGALATEPGWVSPAYGTRLPAPVITVSATGRDAELITIVLVHDDPGAALPRSVRAGADESGGEVALDATTVWWTYDPPLAGRARRSC